MDEKQENVVNDEGKYYDKYNIDYGQWKTPPLKLSSNQILLSCIS